MVFGLSRRTLLAFWVAHLLVWASVHIQTSGISGPAKLRYHFPLLIIPITFGISFILFYFIKIIKVINVY